MNQERQEHRGYALVKEFGLWVAYRSKGYKFIGKHSESTKRDDKGRIPTDIDRIALDTPEYLEACVRLDRRLTKEPKPKHDPTGQMRIDQ
jgi:hypothetical protein